MAKKKKGKKERKSAKSAKSGATTAVKRLKALSKNPLVADVVAAALVATAAALKDSKRARALAEEAGDEIARLSKACAAKGSALWDMALEIARRSVEAMTADSQPPAKRKPATAKKAKPASKSSKRKPPAAAGR